MVTATFADPDGNRFEREVVRHPGAVAVVPLHEDGSVTLVRQYRPAVDRHLLEVPAGIRDVDGEAPELTARRELQEETGLVATKIEPLVGFYNSPGFCDQETLLFVATGLEAGEAAPAGTEERWMEVVRIALDEVDDLTRRGVLVDAQTLIGLQLVRERLRSPA
jgi:ADP-ribose pyrophosphatase